MLRRLSPARGHLGDTHGQRHETGATPRLPASLCNSTEQ